jgi:hypothetical protein
MCRREVPMRIAFAVLSVCALVSAQDAATITVQGCVLDVLGAGVPAAEVTATGDGGKIVGRAFADGDGVFQLARLPAGPRLRISAEGKGKVRAEAWVPRGIGVRALRLTLEDGAELHGAVLDADGKAIAGASVLAYATEADLDDSAHNWSAETTTDSKGGYRLVGVPLHTVLVRAWAPGCVLTSGEERLTRDATRDFTLPAAAEARTVRVVGLPPAVCPTVRIEVYDRDRPESLALPAPLRSVALQPDGRAALWPLPLAHEVMLTAPGYQSAPVRQRCAANSRDELVFRVTAVEPPKPTALHGKVVDADDKPLAGVRVLWGKSRVEPLTAAVTDAQGQFTLAVPLRNNAHSEVAIDDPRWRLGTKTSSVTADGRSWIERTADPAVEQVLRVAPGCTLQGTVRADAGDRLPFATVALAVKDVRVQSGLVAMAMTDRSGDCRLTGLGAGDYLATVTASDGRVGFAEVTLVPGTPGTLSPVAFEPSGEIVGVVRDDRGQPVASARIALDVRAARLTPGQPTPTHRLLRSDKTGHFRARLSADTWVARLLKNEPVVIEVVADKTATVELKAGQ